MNKNILLRHLFGKKTNRKILVIESDDWGSFRFKNRTIRDQYMPNPKPGQWMHYNDCFESYEDLNALEQTLRDISDFRGNSARFTFLMNPANPDFDRIQNSNFEHYAYETFDETLAIRKDGPQILEWYNRSISNKLIEVGFHGREHLNVKSWMNALKQKDPMVVDGFKHRIWGQANLIYNEKRLSYRSNFMMDDKSELKGLKENIKEGLTVLKKVFKKPTTYFLPPDGPYHLSLNQTLADNGIKYIGLARLHQNPLDSKWYQQKPFWLGKKTKEGLKVITRNVMFEPSSPQSADWVSFGMQQVKEAFKYKNPAIIGTHRANYMSGLNPENRPEALKQLKQLLDNIKKTWPDVEFMTSSQLGDELL